MGNQTTCRNFVKFSAKLGQMSDASDIVHRSRHLEPRRLTSFSVRHLARYDRAASNPSGLMAMMSTLPSDVVPIQQALASVPAWTERLRDASHMPILESTASALEEMRSNEDRVDANGLGQLIANDPLMTLKVLAHASTQRSIRAVTDMETVTATLVMMGIPPFFRAFGPQPTVEGQLAGQPAALAGIRESLRRARRAADFALAFAVHRMDPDAPIIHAATLLHDFAELLIWCHAPVLALDIQDRQSRDSSLRSNVVQRQVLNVELLDLQQSLMRTWRLPDLLVRVNDDRHAARPNVRSVQLAVRLARHSANGWTNPALADDIEAIAQLLNLSAPAALHFLHAV